MQSEAQITVRLDHFDGPLALLLHLVQKEEVSLKDLDLNAITDQYLAYLNKMNELNFDVAGEYLYMASQLLFLKSKLCIQEEEKAKVLPFDEEFPMETKADLISRLEELERFQGLGQKLWGLPKLGEDTFTRPRLNRKKIVDSMTAPMELNKLTETMVDFLIKDYRKYKVVKRDRVSIKEKLKMLVDVLKKGEQAEFSHLVEKEKGIDDIVITFISLLELARLKKIGISQGENEGGEIYVDVLEDLSALDVESANGFDEQETTEVLQ